MADDERRNPDDPWVAPPLGSEGASSGTYADPFAAPTEQFPTQATPGSIPPPPSASSLQPSDPFAQPYGQPYAAPGMPGAPRSDKNWMGITSLVTSLISLPFIAVIFGHLGLRAVKRGEANNRGIALAGTILGWIGMAVVLVWIGIGMVWFVTGTQSASTFDDDFTWDDSTPEPSQSATADPYSDLAQPGDGVFGLSEATYYFVVYVNGTPAADTCLAPSSTSGYDLDVVDCSESHVGEIYSTAPLSDLIVDGDVTSDETWAAFGAACDAAFDPYLDADGSATTNQWLFAASDDDNASADDTLMCVASDDFSETTGSLSSGSSGEIY
ncbi:DUF4190 domain-containing protein [Demequina salsinemoris]|uniref:DUF4190 domain-containing protein n=1 Tax=Demequina salsinemoris TaxID=577470 RepID=UPI000780352D|nr:DUF4190 domain-containing protein [Demequina salsinemoris]